MFDEEITGLTKIIDDLEFDKFDIRFTRERRLIEILADGNLIKHFEVSEKETIDEFQTVLEEMHSIYIDEIIEDPSDDLEPWVIYQISKE